MNKISLMLAAALTVFVAQTASAGALAAESKITAVTVFSDRAMIKRSATVKLERGENTITFNGLPLQIAEETLRAEGKGKLSARITGLTVRNVFLENSSQSSIRALETEIEALVRSLKKIDARRVALGSQRDFIESIKVGWSERISKELTGSKPVTGELKEVNSFIGDSVMKVEEGVSDAQEESRPINARLNAVKKQLADMKGSQHKEVRAVDLTLDAPAAMELTIELSYLVMQARWEPLYDIRLAPDGKSAELAYRATVSQNSGEDWQGVKLSLSTAIPSAGSAPPELQPWNVSFREPVRYNADMGQAMAKTAFALAPKAVEAMDSHAERQMYATEVVPAVEQMSRVNEGLTAVLFEIAKPVHIPADGSRQSSLISLETVPVQAEYITTPKLAQAAFLKSEVVNSTSYPLLSGQVNVFNDSAFVGKTELKAVAPGEKFDLFFGSDETIKVKRTATRIQKEAGILAGNSVSWQCSIEIENFKKQPISLSLFEQIPVAGNDEIRVVVKNAQPSEPQILPEGKILWKLSLKPGEKQVVSYLVNIEYPKGKALIGAD